MRKMILAAIVLAALGTVAYTQDSPDSTSSGGLTCEQEEFLAEYYKGSSFNHLSSYGCVKSENSNLLLKDGLPKGLGPDNFSIIWTGQFFFRDKTYQFEAESDDGIRVWLDESLIINEWELQEEAARHRATRSLIKGYHAIRIEYFNGTGKAVAKFGWKLHKGRIRMFGTF